MIVNSIVAKFEEPGAEVTSGGSAEEEAMRKERNKAVVFLVGKVRLSNDISNGACTDSAIFCPDERLWCSADRTDGSCTGR